MPEFTLHNILLADGSQTRPNTPLVVDEPRFQILREMLSIYEVTTVADLGCLEGGYSVGLARLGYDVTAIEVRQNNFDCCKWVESRIEQLPLKFIQSDVREIENFGGFAATVCFGVLYHLDFPRDFLRKLARVTEKILVIDTHFATPTDSGKFNLSKIVSHEGLEGRWYVEFPDDDTFSRKDDYRWASWLNRRSFWLTVNSLEEAMRSVGFRIVFKVPVPGWEDFQRCIFVGLKREIK